VQRFQELQLLAGALGPLAGLLQDIVVVSPDELPASAKLFSKFAEVEIEPFEIIFQGMVKVAAVNKYGHPFAHLILLLILPRPYENNAVKYT
jgi:hypothetical protein